MTTTTDNKLSFTNDIENKRLMITREFQASPDDVWKAWTEKELLDQWWAPKPYKAETKKMDFREGGIWLYCMVGPDQFRQWCRVDFQQITPQKSFSAQDSFCDEEGNINTEFPSMHWKNTFESSATGTKVLIEISFDDVRDLEKIMEMGFKEGFAAALTNLDELFATSIRK